MKYYNAILSYLHNFGGWLMENGVALKQSGMVSLVLGFFGATVAQFWAKVGFWITENSDYITIVLAAVAVDQFLGTLVHAYWRKDFSWLKNIGGFALKLTLVVCMGALFEGLSHLTIEENFIYTYLKMVGRLIVFFYPFRSVCLNCAIMTKGQFPPVAFINKITGFQNTLDIENLKLPVEPKNDINAEH
jgi:hypothetical protein